MLFDTLKKNRFLLEFDVQRNQIPNLLIENIHRTARENETLYLGGKKDRLTSQMYELEAGSIKQDNLREKQVQLDEWREGVSVKIVNLEKDLVREQAATQQSYHKLEV